MARGLNHYLKLLQWSLHHYRAEHDVTIRTANGLLSVSSKDWLIGKLLYVHRNYEIELIRSSIEFLRKENLLGGETNRTIVDVGANLGMISTAMLGENFFEKAIAFEPAPRNFRLLEKNVRQNDLRDRVKTFQLALSSVNTMLEFEIAEDNSGDNRVRKTFADGKMNEAKRRTVEVAAKTLDSVLAENTDIDAAEIDLFWIDIQGHEGHFFKGAREFFRARKVPVVNEFWGYGIARSGMTKDEYCAIIAETFSAFYHFTADGIKLKSIAEIETLFDDYRQPREIAGIILV